MLSRVGLALAGVNTLAGLMNVLDDCDDFTSLLVSYVMILVSYTVFIFRTFSFVSSG